MLEVKVVASLSVSMKANWLTLIFLRLSKAEAVCPVDSSGSPVTQLYLGQVASQILTVL